MVTDAQRRQLYTALHEQLGPGPADVLMDLLPPIGWGAVARRSDIAALDGRISQLDGRISQLDGRIDQLDGRISQLDGRISQLDGRISQLDGRISQLEGRIAAQLPRLIAANLAGGFATAGLVLAAARVA